MAPSNPEFPRRLAEGDDAAAALIARALAEPLPGPSEPQSWRRLLRASARAAPRWVMPALAFGLACVAALVWRVRPMTAPPTSLRPEVWTPRAVASAQPAAAPTAATGLSATRPPVDLRKVLPPATRESDAGQCSQLAKAGQYAAASDCYGRVARGNRMDAELALYEKARLEAKALGQRAQALRTLDPSDERQIHLDMIYSHIHTQHTHIQITHTYNIFNTQHT